MVVEELSAPDYATLDFQPDLVCISSISSTAPRAYELADFYRQQGKTVVLGGAHPSFLAPGRPGARRLRHLRRRRRGLAGADERPGQRRRPGGIQNLCFRRGETIIKIPGAPWWRTWTALPIPNYSLIHGWKAKNGQGRRLHRHLPGLSLQLQLLFGDHPVRPPTPDQLGGPRHGGDSSKRPPGQPYLLLRRQLHRQPGPHQRIVRTDHHRKI